MKHFCRPPFPLPQPGKILSKNGRGVIRTADITGQFQSHVASQSGKSFRFPIVKRFPSNPFSLGTIQTRSLSRIDDQGPGKQSDRQHERAEREIRV